MSTNYIPNGSFETDENWNFYGSDTTPHYVTDVHYDGQRSLRCTQVTTNQTLQTYAQFTVPSGKNYRIRFYAKFEQANNTTLRFFIAPRTGGGNYCNYTLPAEETYTGVKTFNVSIPATASGTVELMMVISTVWLAGATLKNVWIDALEMSEALPYENWALGYIAIRQTKIRKAPSTTSDYWAKFEQGTPLGIKSLSSTTDWYLTAYGQRPTESAYVLAENVNNIEANKVWYDRIAAIAEFYVGKNKNDLSLTNKWCQSFANVCVAQAGLADYNPWVNQSNCADVWNMINRVSIPSKGCLVFTKNQEEDTVSHVALIVSDIASNGDFDVIEGDYNGSSVVTKRSTPMNVSNAHIVGFGCPNNEA